MSAAEALTQSPGLSPEQRAFYDQNGYLVVENAIDPIGLDRVRVYYESLEAALKPAWERSVAEGTFSGGYGNGPNAHTMRPDFERDTALLDLANNPRVIPLIAEIIGPDYQVMEILCHNHHAGAEAHTGWHRDWPPWTHPVLLRFSGIPLLYACERRGSGRRGSLEAAAFPGHRRRGLPEAHINKDMVQNWDPAWG